MCLKQGKRSGWDTLTWNVCCRWFSSPFHPNKLQSLTSNKNLCTHGRPNWQLQWKGGPAACTQRVCLAEAWRLRLGWKKAKFQGCRCWSSQTQTWFAHSLHSLMFSSNCSATIAQTDKTFLLAATWQQFLNKAFFMFAIYDSNLFSRPCHARAAMNLDPTSTIMQYLHDTVTKLT